MVRIADNIGVNWFFSSVEQVATFSAETARAMEQASSVVADLAQQSQALQKLIVEMKNG